MTFECRHNSVFYEDYCKLTVSQWESPETKVRGGIGDSSQYEFDGLNKLVDYNVHGSGTMTIIILRLISQQSLSRVRVNKLLLMVMVVCMALFIGRLVCGLDNCTCCFFLFNIFQRNLFKLHALLVLQIVICSMASMLLHFLDQDNWLRDKHHDRAYESQQ